MYGTTISIFLKKIENDIPDDCTMSWIGHYAVKVDLMSYIVAVHQWFVLADASVTSPRKLCIFIMKINIYRIVVWYTDVQINSESNITAEHVTSAPDFK